LAEKQLLAATEARGESRGAFTFSTERASRGGRKKAIRKSNSHPSSRRQEGKATDDGEVLQRFRGQKRKPTRKGKLWRHLTEFRGAQKTGKKIGREVQAAHIFGAKGTGIFKHGGRGVD